MSRTSLRRRLEALEQAVAFRREPDPAVLEAFWSKLKTMAAVPRTQPLEGMSPASQTAHALFGEVTIEEAQGVADRLETMGRSFPPGRALARVVRESIEAKIDEQRRELRMIMTGRQE